MAHRPARRRCSATAKVPARLFWYDPADGWADVEAWHRARLEWHEAHAPAGASELGDYFDLLAAKRAARLMLKRPAALIFLPRCWASRWDERPEWMRKMPLTPDGAQERDCLPAITFALEDDSRNYDADVRTVVFGLPAAPTPEDVNGRYETPSAHGLVHRRVGDARQRERPAQAAGNGVRRRLRGR
jgi:hypothetical protein